MFSIGINSISRFLLLWLYTIFVKIRKDNDATNMLFLGQLSSGAIVVDHESGGGGGDIYRYALDIFVFDIHVLFFT